MVMKPEWFGFDISIPDNITKNGTEGEILLAMEEAKSSASFEAMKTSFITVGLWWAIFSQYTSIGIQATNLGRSINIINKNPPLKIPRS